MKNKLFTELHHSDIFSHIPQLNYLPRWGILLLDTLLCCIAFWLSVWVGSGFFHYLDLTQLNVHIGVQFLIVMGVQLVAFWAFHTYSGILRYSTFIDTIKVLLSNITTGLALIALNLGYQDPGYFIKVFKKYEGITPNAFRKYYSQKR